MDIYREGQQIKQLGEIGVQLSYSNTNNKLLFYILYLMKKIFYLTRK